MPRGTHILNLVLDKPAFPQVDQHEVFMVKFIF